jgi:Uma2 family endonuclease
MTALAKAPTPQGGPSLPRPDPGRQVVIEAIDWPTYEAIGAALADRPNLRLTYDRGRLEIMTLSPEHERRKYLFGRLIDVLGEEANLPIAGFGSTTYTRERAERGLEPDQCYYHRNLERVRGLQRIDLTRDPPPDLAVEIDVTHSSLDRMRIYAALGVPEVWRFEGGRLEVYLLADDSRYAQSAHSPTFPSIPVAELVRFVDMGVADSDTAMSRAFRAWVREQLAKPD